MNPAGEYKYDIAISLCKEDAQYARDLKAQLNPGLKIFFYEDNQEEIISRCGTEVFASVFKEARVVVILSRKEWGQTFYTELEMHSITDRYKKEGLSFLVVIPMVPGKKPIWYPETMIYANPLNMTLEKIAVVVEYRVTQSGGLIKPVTLEERYRHLQERIEAKKKLIKLQNSEEALASIQEELIALEKAFASKIKFLKNDNMSEVGYRDVPAQDMHMYLNLDHFLLEMGVTSPGILTRRVVLPLDHTLHMHLCTFSGYNTMNGNPVSKDTILSKQYKFLYNKNQKGWAELSLYGKPDRQQESVLFRNRNAESTALKIDYYDLKDPLTSEELVDKWFQELLKHARENISKYI